jgi:lipid-binding SYLF domain-containing protein
MLIYSASKTKGLFAGVSLEGSAIIERKDANAKFYGSPVNKTVSCHVEIVEI